MNMFKPREVPVNYTDQFEWQVRRLVTLWNRFRNEEHDRTSYPSPTLRQTWRELMDKEVEEALKLVAERKKVKK